MLRLRWSADWSVSRRPVMQVSTYRCRSIRSMLTWGLPSRWDWLPPEWGDINVRTGQKLTIFCDDPSVELLRLSVFDAYIGKTEACRIKDADFECLLLSHLRKATIYSRIPKRQLLFSCAMLRRQGTNFVEI